MNIKYSDTSLDKLKAQCIEVRQATNPIEMVEFWIPCYLNEDEKKKPRKTHIEVLRSDGWWDSIYFEVGQEELAKTVYNELKEFNRPITPLEKFHSSF